MEKLKLNFEITTDSSIEDKMLESYLSCPAAMKYCREQGISDEAVKENIAKIFDFVSDINYCKNCPGIEKCQKNNPLTQTKIINRNGIVDVQITPCNKLLKKVSFSRQFQEADFDEDWLNSTMKDIDESKERVLAIKKYHDFIKTGKSSWIYLNGEQSTGRSFLAAALVVDAAKREKGPICYLNCSKRINELKEMSSKKNEEFQETLNRYSTVPILVLDDFGNEYKNDFIRDAIVFQILSTRANKRLFTIITSDFSFEEIETLYTTSKAGEIRAKQIGRILKAAAEKEINLGELSIY